MRTGLTAGCRRGLGVGLRAAAAALALLAWSPGAGAASPGNGGTTGHAHHHPKTNVIAAVEAGLLPWQLAVPISREVVLPGANGQLTVLGGLTAGGTSATGISSLDPADGALGSLGSLPAGVHDAAGAVVRGRDLVFGGGSPTTVGTIDVFSPASGAGAAVAGQLPAPRSDAVGVSVGKTTYIVGGYDGSNPDASVLATTNGTTFTSVARLRVPVRYPAVAALGGELYVFGGEPVGATGTAVDLIQAVNPATHAVSVVGRLPEPLVGSVAVVLGGAIYVAGGSSPTPQAAVPGMGSAVPPPPGTRGSPVSTIWAFDPKTGLLLAAGRLQEAVAYAGAAVVSSTAWIVGGEVDGDPVAAVQMLRPNRAFGGAGEAGAGSPYFGGRLLVADRGNNRLLLLDPSMRADWTYPSATSPPNPGGFYFPDDAFFADKGTAIISNQEENETIEEIAFPSGRVIWSYGHPGQAGSSPGYLHEPDDAYVLKDHQISVADADNCRVLVINPDGSVADQIGTTGSCVHDPPSSMGSPNGDTPLADGNLLVSEINGSWVSEYTPDGRLVWTLQLPIGYPSDPQQLGSDLYLVADYASPGQLLEFDRAGQVSWRYDVTSGPGTLDHPSLAERLPSGVVMLNDDYGDRMVAIDPVTDALVWQYGVTGVAGTGPGLLNTPDGFDLLMPRGTTPTHPATG